MPFLEANGQNLYYEQHGEGEPLFCVMGLGADHLSWMLQLPAFSKRYRTTIFDNRDVGQSSYVEGNYEVTDMAADALALADELELDSFHLLGVSMGGAISQELALASPERVRTLSLAVTWAYGGEFARYQSAIMGKDAMRLTFEEQVDRFLLLLLSEDYFDQPGAVDMARNILLSNPNPQKPEGFARQADACGRHDTRDRLASLEMPVNVIGAEHDILVPVWKSKEIAETIPGATYTVLERAAHGVQIERAEQFNAAVLDFLAARSELAAA